MTNKRYTLSFSGSNKINILLVLSFFCPSIVCLKENNVETHGKDYVAELVSRCRYPIEVHRNIKTEDGYLLTMQRIPVTDQEYNWKKDKMPVLLMHGVFASAEQFLLLNCTSSLAFMLSNEGYDVWMGNVRTVSYSRHHDYLDPDKVAYWNINVDHFGSYDLPTFIDYILKTTGYQQIMYVGHSQGSMIYYIMCNNKPEYASKVRLFVQLSPFASPKNFAHPWLSSVCKRIDLVQNLVNVFGLYEWTLGRGFFRKYGTILCTIMSSVCKNIIYAVYGLLPSHLPDDQLNRLVINAPEAIAAYQFIHACFMVRDGEFEKYNYGSAEENMIHYGSPTPPIYDLTLMTTPSAIYYSTNDWYLDVNTAREIVKTTPNVVDVWEITLDHFSHIDFVLGHYTSQVNARIVKVINAHRSN